MLFYEERHSLRSDHVEILRGENLNYRLHLHGSFELIAVTEGEMRVNIDKKQYVVGNGEAVLVFPNQLHSLETPRSSKHILCIFSPELVQAYRGVFLDKRPVDHLFRPKTFYVEELAKLGSTGNPLAVKGLLYTFCAEFDAVAKYEEKKGDKEALLLKIFRFVEENYAKDCSLEALSAAISYHSVYLSRCFKQWVGISFTDYVNRYRISEACYVLKNTDQSVLQTAYDCGFDSLRSFNRNFKRITGTTPGEFRHGQRESVD